MECAKCTGPCSWRPPPDPPPCPPPPKKRFNWWIPLAILAFLTLLGLIYQYYLYLLKQMKMRDKKWYPRPPDRTPFYDSDLPDCVQYLIVGAGPAGWAAYKAIRKEDPKAMVFIITEEDAMPYKRFPMSRLMWWNNNPPRFSTLTYLDNMLEYSMYETKCECFMDSLKFKRKKEGPGLAIGAGWEVLGVDADEHVVWVKTYCGERPIYYERCLLAPGSRPRYMTVLRGATRNVRERMSTFRTVRDLEVAYQRVRSAKHITIIGGGLLGTELAWHISRMHKMWLIKDKDYEPVKITMLVKDPGLLGNILPTYLSEWLKERVKCCRINIIPNAQVLDAYDSEDKRLELSLSNGSTLVTDFAFMCVGTEPRVELAPRSMLEVDKKHGGYVANTEGQIRRHLYTAGDAASIYMQEKGYRMRFDHLTNAIETGTIAGRNMTGLWEPTNIEPHFELKLGKTIEIEAVGEIGACMPTIGLYRPCEGEDTSDIYHLDEAEQAEPCNIKEHEYMNRYKHGIIFYFRHETIVGIVFWNLSNKVPDRKEATVEVLRAKPTYEDINLIADLLGFFNQECELGDKPEAAIVIPCPTTDPDKLRFPAKIKEETLKEKCERMRREVEELSPKHKEDEKDEEEEDEPPEEEDIPDIPEDLIEPREKEKKTSCVIM